MRYSDRSKRTPYVKPVKRVEVSDEHTTLRMVLIVALLALGATALVIGLFGLLNTEPGWQTIEVTTKEANCSQDFTLNYDFSDSGSAATAQHKQLIALYTEAAENAFRIFSPHVGEEGMLNLQYLNAHPNETVSVDPALFDALSLIHRFGNRSVYLAPVYVEYNRIFLCENESDAAAFDPGQNEELVEYIRQVSAFANDPRMIDLEILEENRVRLHVSDAYLAFAREYEIESFLDFGWMKNAFITDYLADVLVQNGFTSGYLVSYDGFTRNLDTRGNTYSFNIFDRVGDAVNLPAVMEYDRPVSIVFLRNYPMVDLDRWHYFSFSGGRIVTSFIDPADGMSKSSIDSLVGYSYETGCAEMLMRMAPLFVSDAFSADGLHRLSEDRIHSIWCDDWTLCHTEEALKITLQPQKDTAYTVKYEG